MTNIIPYAYTIGYMNTAEATVISKESTDQPDFKHLANNVLGRMFDRHTTFRKWTAKNRSRMRKIVALGVGLTVVTLPALGCAIFGPLPPPAAAPPPKEPVETVPVESPMPYLPPVVTPDSITFLDRLKCELIPDSVSEEEFKRVFDNNPNSLFLSGQIANGRILSIIPVRDGMKSVKLSPNEQFYYWRCDDLELNIRDNDLALNSASFLFDHELQTIISNQAINPQ